ncbi:MAG: putative lipid II flippase FtsW [Acidobacteria bacterium]|nr:putative lipid II flippase FtsW [Acidobacteriota bacterium]
MAPKVSWDKWLFLTMTALVLFGLVMAYSASAPLSAQRYGAGHHLFLRQLGWALLGWIAMLGAMRIDYWHYDSKRVVALALLLAGVLLMAALGFPSVNGSRRWIRLGTFSFQPSEAAKPALLLFLAFYLSRRGHAINQLTRNLLPCLAVVGAFLGLILLESDLGTAVCLALVVTVVLFVGGLSVAYFAGLAALCASVVLYMVTQVSYRWERIVAFLDPWSDPLRSGYQIIQSLIAVGTGGISGAGLGQGKQKLFFLPYPHSDFIYAVIGEEVGLVGSVLVLLAFLLFFWRGMRTAVRAPDPFGSYLALGLTLVIVLQAMIHISVALSLVPTKGIPLPFVSMGGSSMLVSLAMAGVLLNISHHSP